MKSQEDIDQTKEVSMAQLPEQPHDHSVPALMLWIDILQDDLREVQQRNASLVRTLQLEQARRVAVERKYTEQTGEICEVSGQEVVRIAKHWRV